MKKILQDLQILAKSTNSKAALDHGWRGCFCVLPCITNIDHQAPRDLINLSQPKSRWKLEWNSLNTSNWFTKYGPKISLFFSKLSQTEQFHGLIIVQLCHKGSKFFSRCNRWTLPSPSSVLLGIQIWILAKFRNKKVNFMAKNNGHQNFTKSLGIPTPPLI